MKIMFVEAKRKLDVNTEEIDLSILPDEIFLAYSIQFKEIAEKIKKKLGKKVKGFQQVLGCSVLKSKFPVLLIGSGRFHAMNLALKGNTVYVLENNKASRLDEKEVGKVKGKRKAALSKFLASDKTGILVSCKPGQENLKKAIKLKKKLEKKGKKLQIFLSDNINIEELENYNIESWVNASCPALSYDSRIINLHEIV